MQDLFDACTEICYNSCRKTAKGADMMQCIGRIGVLVPEITDPLDYELLHGIQAQAFSLGYDVIVFSGIYNSQTEMQRDDYIKGLENIYNLIGKARLDGILYASDRFHHEMTSRQIEQLLMQTDVPCLVLGEDCPPFQNLYPRQQESIYRMTKHLIDVHGCKRLYCITGFPNHHSSEERAAGFRQAMHEAGLPVQPSDIFYGHFWKDIPAQIAQQIADGTLETPDGIVCTSDPMALALAQSLIRNGIRVPEDVRITGYDGSWDSWLESPHITTVCGRDRQYGADAVCQLYEMMTGQYGGYSDYAQTVQSSESCGCNTAGGQSIDALMLEPYFRTHILHAVEKKKYITANLIDRLKDCDTLKRWTIETDHVGYVLPGWKQLDICLCDDWCANGSHPEQVRQTGFSDQMLLALSKRYGENEHANYLFPTADLLPSLCVPHEPKLLLLTSLHAHGQIFGYLATAYDTVDGIQADEFFINWCDAVVSGLYNLQQRIVTEQMKAQIALLTVHDPETGFYNQRGLAEQLPEMLRTAHRHQTVAQLLLVTYHEVSRYMGYEAALLLASSLRHTAPEHAVCSRLGDTLFAVMYPQPVDTDALLEQIEQRFQKLLGANASAPKLITSLLPLQFDTLGETEHSIEEATEALVQKAASAAEGYFDYKSILTKLRREIMAAPQREWSIPEMAQSIGISRTHLQRLYKQHFSVSCIDDVINARMNRAKQLLTYTDLRIQEIALQCGYHNESHFMRQFKERVGMTAVQYRNQSKK